MSTSAAFAGIAAANSAQAAAHAHRARVESCKVVTAQFEKTTATVEQQQEYASCINTLHPREMTDGGILAVKILIVLMLVGLVAGIVQAARDRYTTGLMDYFMLSFMWGLGLPVLGVALAGIVCATWWLFQ